MTDLATAPAAEQIALGAEGANWTLSITARWGAIAVAYKASGAPVSPTSPSPSSSMSPRSSSPVSQSPASASPSSGSVALTAPVAKQTFQRNGSNQATFTVTGTRSGGPANQQLEYSLAGAAFADLTNVGGAGVISASVTVSIAAERSGT